MENLAKLKTLKNEGFIVFSRTRNDIFSELLMKNGVNVNLVSDLCTEEQNRDLDDYKREYYERFGNTKLL